MFKIPIISISINEQLREFINKLVRKNQYENKSKLIRDALLRLMSTMEISNLESFGDISPSTKSVIGNLLIVAPLDSNVQRKLNKVESEYNDKIVSKNQHFQGENVINFLIFEGDLQTFQEFVVEINGIKELKNFRYLIIN
ncbi:MAG: CopG family ribbon-helix-helix protein [Promethearchaeota archaeon]